MCNTCYNRFTVVMIKLFVYKSFTEKGCAVQNEWLSHLNFAQITHVEYYGSPWLNIANFEELFLSGMINCLFYGLT